MKNRQLFQLLFVIFLTSSILESKKRSVKINDEYHLMTATVPKSGTNLLTKLIRLIDPRKGILRCSTLTALDQCEIDALGNRFYVTHAPCVAHNYNLAQLNNLKVIVIFRDPRDVLISYIFWLKKGRGHQLEPAWPLYEDLPMDEIIMQFIKEYPTKGPQIPPYKTIDEFFDLYLHWESYPDVYITTFEKLVGPEGGGDKETQESEIRNIAHFINKTLSDDDIGKISSKLFGGTGTFREGQSGSWKKHFNEKHKEMLKSIPGFNNFLIKLGYEKDTNW